MYPWEGVASQIFGGALGQTQQQDLSGAFGGGMSPYSSGNYIPITTAPEGTCDTPYLTDSAGDLSIRIAEEKAEEPPDEFTQLSNHKFHELLDRFSKTI